MTRSARAARASSSATWPPTVRRAYAALAGRVRLLVADGRVPLGDPAAGRARAGRRARAEPGHGHRRLRAAARGRLGRPPARAPAPRRAAGRAAHAAPGCRARPTDGVHRPGPRRARRRPPEVPAAFAAALAELPRLPAPARLPPGRAAGAAGPDRRAVHRPRPADDAGAGARHRRRAARRRRRCPDCCCGRATGCWSSSPTYPNALDAARAQRRRSWCRRRSTPTTPAPWLGDRRRGPLRQRSARRPPT